MERRIAARAAWWIWGVVATVAGATPILMFVGRSLMKPGDVVLSAFAIVAGGAFGVVGALIVARRGNTVGWTLLGIRAGFVITIFTGSYAVAAFSRPGGLPAWRVVAWIGMWLWIPSAAPVALLLILFPTGRLTSRRFRPVLWIGATGVAVATIATALNAPAADDQFGNVILSALPIREAHGVFLPKPTSAMRRSFLRIVIDIGGGHTVTWPKRTWKEESRRWAPARRRPPRRAG